MKHCPLHLLQDCNSSCALYDEATEKCSIALGADALCFLADAVADEIKSNDNITNREFLRTCTNDEFAEIVLRKSAELEKKYMDSELDAFDLIDCIEADFAEWLDKGRE